MKKSFISIFKVKSITLIVLALILISCNSTKNIQESESKSTTQELQGAPNTAKVELEIVSILDSLGAFKGVQFCETSKCLAKVKVSRVISNAQNSAFFSDDKLEYLVLFTMTIEETTLVEGFNAKQNYPGLKVNDKIKAAIAPFPSGDIAFQIEEYIKLD
jgi:hypothetical protein